MSLRILVGAIVVTAALSGCGTASNFVDALEKPVEAADAARSVASNTEREMIKAKALGMIDSVVFDREDLVCTPTAGPANVVAGLGAFGNALKTVKEVGEKPDGTSFSAYVKAFRTNQENIEAASEDPMQKRDREQRELKKRKAETEARCQQLYKADSAAPLNLYQTPKPATGGTTYALIDATIGLAKKIMGAAEAAQREKAVVATVVALVPVLNATVTELSAAPVPDFGPLVKYSPDALQAKDNETVLGASINIRRWMLVKQIDAIGANLKQCGSGDDQKRACLGDASRRKNADDLAELILQYRSAANIDSTKVLTTLKVGVENAGKATKQSFPQLLDALVDIGDALEGISSGYTAYAAARN